MNWDAIGALGEIGGAIAVVATLFYLSRQISQNSKSLDRANDFAQASSVHDINSLYIQVFSSLAHDSELAGIYKKALDGEELDGVEAIRYSSFVNSYLAWLEDMYVQQGQKLGFATENLSSLYDTSRPYVRKIMLHSSSRDWWESEGVHLYSTEFIEWINKILNDD
jgi:hypothetical protein